METATRILEYRARGAATDLFRCRAPEVLIEGPAGTGKSRAVGEFIHWCCESYPNIRVLVLRKTRASLTESWMVTFEQKVLPDDHEAHGNHPSRHSRHDYKYNNGSMIVLGGMDKPTRIFSTEYDLIYCNEANELTEAEFESLQRALRNNVLPWQQIIADCNPDHPKHWLNQRASGPLMKRLLSRHKDNPTLTPEYLERLSRLTGVRRLRLFEGKWAAAEGVIYEEFDPLIHVVDRFEIPADWRRFRVIDFGYVNAFVCQWWAMDGDGRLYRYREIYCTRRIVQDHARRIKSESEGEAIEITITDHDAEDRATLDREGIHSIPAMKEVTSGIDAVKSRLKVRADGKPRLFLMRDSLVELDASLREAGKPHCTEDEFGSYIWKRDREGKAAKDEPMKEHDHGMDTMRYMVMHLDGKPGLYFSGGDVVISKAKQPVEIDRYFDSGDDDDEN